MTTLDDLFRAPANTLPHPRLRDWKRRRDAGATAKLELYRPATALGLAQTEMNLHFAEDGKQTLETVAWDDDLNTGLIQLKVLSVDADQEAERFALGLRGALRKAGREFGDGYFNSVLVELITDSDLTHYPEIAEVLKHSTALRPDREGKAYTFCREMIADAISGRAHELKGLGYEEEEAKRILVQALARYLDERFSVSNRRRLGLL
jgi:hypothetical protein